MNPIIQRRASLGLAINGPFSRNRRRPLQWGNLVPYAISAAIMLGIILFFTSLFLL